MSDWNLAHRNMVIWFVLGMWKAFSIVFSEWKACTNGLENDLVGQESRPFVYWALKNSLVALAAFIFITAHITLISNHITKVKGDRISRTCLGHSTQPCLSNRVVCFGSQALLFSLFCFFFFLNRWFGHTCSASDQFILLLGLMTTCFIRTDKSLVLMLRNFSNKLEMQMPKINSRLSDSFLEHKNATTHIWPKATGWTANLKSKECTRKRL